MKQLIITIAALSFVNISIAQEQKNVPVQSKTKLQAFDALAGAVIIKGYSQIGAVAGMGQVSISAKQFTNASTGRSEYGITIEVKETGRLQREDTSFIDYDEIESLLAGVDYVKRLKQDVTKLRGFEAVYRTRGDFSIAVFGSTTGKVDAAVSSGRATAFLPLEKLESLRALVVEAKKTLDGIKK